MASLFDPFDQQFADLQLAYQQQLGGRLSAIESSWEHLSTQGWDVQELRHLHIMVHSLAGSGASFGFAALSTAARTLEMLLISLQKQGSAPSLPQKIQIQTLLASLKQAVPRSEAPAISPPPEERLPAIAERWICLWQDDFASAEELAAQLRQFGYAVSHAATLEALQQQMRARLPAALIVDISMMGTINRIQGRQAMPPLVFISDQHDLQARLQAVQAGGKAYFTKPLDIASLIDRLDDLTCRREQEPYRVLIVDDEPVLAAFHSLLLLQQGMLTVVVTDPGELLPKLADFNPDLILMDLYLPGCSGPELAAVIRQQQTYLDIPIVYLSTETDIDAQLAAMSQEGGDEFLTKPIKPDHLISAVTSRAQRSRTLRSLMVRDSLTGLLNHTKLKDHLAQEMLRAKRQQTQFAFAMIDLDRFKRINDLYGHAAGDRVLKSLSRLLQQRLRKTDIIGRYGGEEFAIILPETPLLAAHAILDQIRQAFAQVEHQVEEVKFTATLSCGIAGFPAHADLSGLCRAADKALYQAKRQGRNRVLT